MTDERMMDILFEVIEFARKETQKSFYDWKDADDHLFAELEIKKSELDEIYKGRGVFVYYGSAIEG